MDEWVKNRMVTALDLWSSVFWPRYRPRARRSGTTAPLLAGGLVTPVVEVVGLQTVQGLMVSCARLGVGVVDGFDDEGKVLVRWSQAGVETWVDCEDLCPVEAGWCLVTLVRRDARGHRTLLRHSMALLQHHWTIELLPDNVVRAVRTDGLAWTFSINPISQLVTASWLYPPEDEDAEALAAAEMVAS